MFLMMTRYLPYYWVYIRQHKMRQFKHQSEKSKAHKAARQTLGYKILFRFLSLSGKG